MRKLIVLLMSLVLLCSTVYAGVAGHLKANTAVDVLIGPFIADANGTGTMEALTIAQADVRLSKNGQNMAQKNDNTTCVHDELGYYNCELDATDLNTEGTLTLCVHKTDALPVRLDYVVLSEAAWDSLYAAKDTGYMDINVKAVSEDTAAANNLETACDNYSVTRGLTGTALPAAAADAAGGLIVSDAGGVDIDVLVDDIGDIDANTILILADTSAVDTTTEMRTFLTGSDTAVSTLTSSDNIGINWNDVSNPTSTVALTNTTVGTVSTLTGHTAQTGNSYPLVQDINENTTLILADTNELQQDDIPAEIQAHAVTIAGINDELSDMNDEMDEIDANIALCLADTAELQGDWADGGRLDNLLDSAGGDVTADVNSAMEAYGLQYLFHTAVTDVDCVGYNVAENSLLGLIMAGGDANDWNYQTYNLTKLKGKLER